MSSSNPATGRPTGLTRDAGWEIGVSRTVAVPLNVVWSFVTSDEGVAIWLGGGATLPTEPRAPYETDDGTTGEVRSFREQDRVRLTWRPRDWEHDSTVQLAVSGDDEKTMIRFHQERLASAEERGRMREHWQSVLERLIAGVTPSSPSRSIS